MWDRVAVESRFLPESILFFGFSKREKLGIHHHIRNMIFLTKGGVNHVRVE